MTSTPPETFPDAAASDPRALGWMQGAPPAPDRVIAMTDRDLFRFPKSRWAFSHMRQLAPTAGVSRGLGAPSTLGRRIDDAIDGLTFTPIGGATPVTWAESLAANYTDGLVVLHDGDIVYETYAGALTETGQHCAFSVTKSMMGLLAESLIVEGALDPDAPVADLIAELAGSAFGDATVRQVLDMTTGLRYSETYADPKADVWVYSAATSPLPKPEGFTGPRTFFDYLRTVAKDGEHGEAFAYKTINTDALGWILARTTGRSTAELLSERIWSRIGAEQDGYMTIDSIGVPFAGGGLSAGLRDLARVGQMVLDGGVAQGRQIVPSAAIDSLFGGGDPARFAKAGYGLLPGWSYRGMWWITHNAHRAIMARGVYGQSLYVDPTARMVIARFSSHPIAANAGNDPVTLPAFQAVGEHLARR
ncbi:serine hydrolase domain-containing protein [Caulobacter mirabilis]|uniref:6-aminohexanoate hydrolase n=1 Tax=Caulobacter mirabilis TaxID=69666 RepID=A0A2D2B1Y6_9CAUL|nr:serine hydrolase [Caulobacter mirabilis]ATQ44270.1 6-aminohexanoate hydrolase [Caulobacter mirabilis]